MSAPATGSKFSFDAKAVILPIVMGVVFIVIGMTAGSIAGGVGQFVIQTLNNSLGGGITINMFSTSTINLLETVFTMAGIGMIVAVLSYIIYLFIESVMGIKT